MYAKLLGGSREVPTMTLQHLADETLLELPPSIREEHALFDHFGNESVKRVLHVSPLPEKHHGLRRARRRPENLPPEKTTARKCK